jgi:putative oxidoreductase
MDAGLLLARAVFGLLMIAHGSQKLLGWFGGYGLSGTARSFEGLGFRPGRLFVATAATTECVSGALMSLGFVTPVAGALMIALMIVATVTVHWQNGLLATQNGIEVPALYAVGATALTLAGPGAYSFDAALGLTAFWTPVVIGFALVVGILGGVAGLALRRAAMRTVASRWTSAGLVEWRFDWMMRHEIGLNQLLRTYRRLAVRLPSSLEWRSVVEANIRGYEGLLAIGAS